MRGLFPRTEKEGSRGSSGLECPSVRAGDGAVQVGELGSRDSDGGVASPKYWGADGGDEGGGSEGEVDRLACIQGSLPHSHDSDEPQHFFLFFNSDSERVKKMRQNARGGGGRLPGAGGTRTEGVSSGGTYGDAV